MHGLPSSLKAIEQKELFEFGEGRLASEAKIMANRQNALNSTGPKDTSLTRFNALKHGLTAGKIVVTPFEDPAEYEILVEALRKDFQPQTAIEELLIQQMASSLWRRQRIIRGERVDIESGLTSASMKFDTLERKKTDYLLLIMHQEVSKQDLRQRASAKRWRRWREKQPPEEQARLAAIAENPPSVDILRLEDARKEARDLEETAEKRKQLHLESQLSINPDALKIRYDSSLERQFYRALIMLLKIKEARARGNGFVSQT
jgi:hypothetical protein